MDALGLRAAVFPHRDSPPYPSVSAWLCCTHPGGGPGESLPGAEWETPRFPLTVQGLYFFFFLNLCTNGFSFQGHRVTREKHTMRCWRCRKALSPAAPSHSLQLSQHFGTLNGHKKWLPCTCLHLSITKCSQDSAKLFFREIPRVPVDWKHHKTNHVQRNLLKLNKTKEGESNRMSWLQKSRAPILLIYGGDAQGLRVAINHAAKQTFFWSSHIPDQLTMLTLAQQLTTIARNSQKG